MTEWKVEFLGNGYECVSSVRVIAPTPGDALERAMAWYLRSDSKFDFIGLEVSEW